MTHRYGIVSQVRPGSRTLDLVMTDTGERIRNVQVMTHSASSDTGSWDTPSVTKPGSEAKAGTLGQGRNMVAVCAPFINGSLLVIGFVAPLGHSMGFSEDDRTVHRHASGAYTTIAPDGSHETYHPSGAYVRVGAGAHQGLAGASADGNWVEKTGAAEPTITVHNASCTITILPGNGGITVDAPGSPVTMNYLKATLNGPVTINGALAVNGPVSFNQGAGGGSGTTINTPVTVNSPVQVNGTATITQDAVIAGGSYNAHQHDGVKSGSNTSNPPVKGT